MPPSAPFQLLEQPCLWDSFIMMLSALLFCESDNVYVHGRGVLDQSIMFFANSVLDMVERLGFLVQFCIVGQEQPVLQGHLNQPRL